MGPPDPEKENPLTPGLAAEGAGDADRNLTARLGRYGTAKNRNHQMAGYLLTQRERSLSTRLYRCGGYLRFREWLHHDNRMTLHEGRFCKVHLLCPLCAIRRGGHMLRRYVERARFIARDHDLWMVTLTVKNGPDLFERFQHLKGAVRKIRQRAAKGYGMFSVASGALWSYEFTRGQDGLWHPHVHMVWAMPKGTPIQWGKDSQLGMDWFAATGDSYIVHAERIGAGEGAPVGEGPTATATDPLIKAFCEVLKYALKFSSLSLEDNYGAFLALRGKRLLASSGIWYGLELPEDAQLEDDPLDGPYIEHLYRYAGSKGYVLEDVTLMEPQVEPTLAPERTHEIRKSTEALRRFEDHCHAHAAR